MITKEDRHKYGDCTDKTILGIKLIEGLTNEVLRGLALEYQGVGFGRFYKALFTLMGCGTNPNWIMGKVVDEMYSRDMVDEFERDRLSELCS